VAYFLGHPVYRARRDTG